MPRHIRMIFDLASYSQLIERLKESHCPLGSLCLHVLHSGSWIRAQAALPIHSGKKSDTYTESLAQRKLVEFVD